MICFARAIRKLSSLIVLTLAVFIILAITFAQTTYVVLAHPLATTWHVPADFPKIQQAINAATDGDTILVATGTYTENLSFSGKNLVLQSTSGPFVTSISAPSPGGTVVDIGPNGQIIGFKIINGAAYWGGGIEVHGTNTIIRGNIIENNTALVGGAGAGIDGNLASPLIEKNLFHNNTCDNQYLSGVVSFYNSSSPQIVNNIFVDNPCRAINMTLPEGTAPFVSNNTIVRNEVGIRVDARVNTSAHLYQNNIIVDNKMGVQVDSGYLPTFPNWRNNLVFGNNTNYFGTPNQTGNNGNKSVDPLFVDFPKSNFELRIGSPAIDAGNNTKCPAADFRGVLRPQNKICDIGAFEFQLPIVPVVPAEVPEADTLLLISGGLSTLATWIGWQFRKIRAKK